MDQFFCTVGARAGADPQGVLIAGALLLLALLALFWALRTPQLEAYQLDS